MLEELNKYNQKGNFKFTPLDKLSTVCTAPNNCSGIYLIYALTKGNRELIYIGISGRKGIDGKIIHRKDGLRDRFLTGKQFGDRRQISWVNQMNSENIEALDIYWYATYGDLNNDFPRDLEIRLLSKYRDKHGFLPRWNNEI
jgi:hypothetical protein